VTKEELAKLRYRARTDLYWLAKDILGMDALVERVHRPVCDTFVAKKPGRPLWEQSEIKERLILLGRGHFKTSLDEADIIQWILLDPNIRILVMSGKSDVAESMIRNIKAHFQTNDKLRALFPEYCPPANSEFGNLSEFTIPARNKPIKEPTVLSASGGSVKAGLHFDVIKGDDIVNEFNSATKDLILKTIRTWNYAMPLVEPYGYLDLIGTNYDDSDLYQWSIENKPKLLVYKRPAWSPKHGYKQAFKNGSVKKITEDMVDLLFPERFTFEWLNNQRLADEYIFNCQYLLDPTPTDTALFTEELILRHTIPHGHIPHSGSVFQVWDTASTTNSNSDYSACATGLYDSQGRLFVLDIAYGRWSPTELVNMIIGQAIKWRPRCIGIEEANGSRMLQPALELHARQLGMSLYIEWQKTSPNKHKNDTIAGLQPLLKDDMLYISAAMSKETKKELLKQFIKFPKTSHDDIPDAISRLLTFRNRIDIEPVYDEFNPQDVGDTVSYTEDDYLLGAGLVG
jgi:predicted phage terminase large subunit-like protein